jgi:hypothetical protein
MALKKGFLFIVDDRGVGRGVAIDDLNQLVTTSILQSTEEGVPASVQYPLPTDGDSVYAKDIWVDQSIATDWLDEGDTASAENILIPFTNLHTVITNTTATNPKILRIHFNRTINAHQVGLGCVSGDDFSNVKVVLLGSGGVERTVNDDSGNATKYTSRDYGFEPELFNALQLEFHTADPVCISNITIQKSVNVGAQIQGLKADGTIDTVNLTNGANLKISLEELESGISVNANSQLRVTPFASSGAELAIDPNTSALVGITQEHHEIHEGDHYFYSDFTTLASAAVLDIVLITPDTTKQMHYIARFSSTLEISAELFRGITESGDGTPITPENSFQDSSNVALMQISRDPTVTDTGTRVRGHSGGTGGPFGVGSTANRANELILARNTKYLIRVISGANDNIIDWDILWYEHTPGA